MQKDQNTRILECISIRKQLQDLGVFVVPDIATIVSTNMNDYIKKGVSRTFMLKTKEKGIMFRVLLAESIGKQSGIEMIK